MTKPTVKPSCPNFSSGPCAKRPGWTVEALKNALVGRSHRSKEGIARIRECTDRMKKVLNLPEGYRIGLIAGSDTGAVELALWNLLGTRPVDMFGWETFGKDWMTDVVKQLKIKDVNQYTAPYGELPDLSKADFSHDVVFTWNGTTSGVCLPNADWIPADREGLTICDATSGIFAMDIDFTKMDVVTFSWQKVLGGEAAHGIIILSPRAVKAMIDREPKNPYPLPKIFRLASAGKLAEGELEYSTVNTPSMICVEDAIDALKWAEAIGGVPAMVKRSQTSLGYLADWVKKNDWIEFLCKNPKHRSSTSVCLKVVADWFMALDASKQSEATKKMSALLAKEGVAYDINSYKTAPIGFRVWCGATVEPSDVKALCAWLSWAYEEISKEYK